MARRFFYDTEFVEEPGSIELISIGVVAEDPELRNFYAINKDFRVDRANDWVKKHVLSKLESPEDHPNYFQSCENIKGMLLDYLKPTREDPVELWAWYADYDHVTLCWILGKMIDLPSGMPRWTRDIKQLAWHLGIDVIPNELAKSETLIHNAKGDALWNRKIFKYLKTLAEQKEIRV